MLWADIISFETAVTLKQ